MSEAYHMARMAEEPGFKYLEHVEINIKRSVCDGLKTLEYDLPCMTSPELTSLVRIIQWKGYEVKALIGPDRLMISWEHAI